MIAEILEKGEQNARTGREICSKLNMTPRQLTRQIEKERRAGEPICARCKGRPHGYFLAADKEEMQTYINRLHHRAGEIFKTRRACIKAAAKLPERAARDGTADESTTDSRTTATGEPITGETINTAAGTTRNHLIM